MTKKEIEVELRRADEMTNKLLAKRPNDEDLLGVKVGLERIHQMVEKQWPLSPKEKEQINIGMYAFRVLEGGPYGDLPNILLDLSADLREN